MTGTHNGTITPTQTITVQKLYTYPCTDGHTEYASLWNSSRDVNATWNGYKEDWHNLSFKEPFSLVANEEYIYTIRTGSFVSADSPYGCTANSERLAKLHRVHRCEWQEIR